MLNYIALGLLAFLLGTKGFQAAGSNQAISRTTHGTGAAPPPVRLRRPACTPALLIALLAAVGSGGC